MQTFRQHEFVYLGTEAEGARAHRDAWMLRAAALTLHRSLGLDGARRSTANDPFFGRTGKLLAANQRSSSQLKIETRLAPVSSTRVEHTAITSANLHLEHFGHEFGITNRRRFEVAHHRLRRLRCRANRVGAPARSTASTPRALGPADLRQVLAR